MCTLRAALQRIPSQCLDSGAFHSTGTECHLLTSICGSPSKLQRTFSYHAWSIALFVLFSAYADLTLTFQLCTTPILEAVDFRVRAKQDYPLL